MRLRHGVPDERNAHRNRIPNAGTQLPADASILWGNEMDAYENRIPIHYIKRDTFWVGRDFAFWRETPPARTRMQLESRRFGFRLGDCSRR